MMNQDGLSEADVETILSARWADPQVFSATAFAGAESFWRERRREDDRLLSIRSRAAAMVREWTGRECRDVGSFGLRLNLETSDLDLGIGYPVGRRSELMRALERHTTFKGERVTRFPGADQPGAAPTSTRLVFSFVVDGVEIDLSALAEEDFAVSKRMLDAIDRTMTERERIAHTWVKHLLRTSGRLHDYAEWKLVTYARFCPEFTWVPIPEKV